MSEWEKVRLGEVAELVPGFAFKSKAFGDKYDDKVIKITNISENGICVSELTGVDLSGLNRSRLEKYKVTQGDFVIAMTGATIGKFGRITEGNAYINQRVLTVRERSNSNQYFLYCVVRTREFHRHIMTHIDSNSAQANISAGSIAEYEFSLPPLPTQRKIAAVLGALDDKIENNRKICANLEAQAQAIFKSWFVDFEPFGGKMPQGWKMGKLGDVCKIFDSRRIPLSSLQRAEMQGGIPYYGATSIVDYVNDFLLEGIYLLMGEDGSVITDKGYPFLQYIWGKFWPNNHAHVLQGTNGYTTEMLYCLLSQTKVERYVTGAVQPKISQGNMIMIPACIPEGSDAKKFSGMIQPLFDELRCITDESRSLAATRDALLPKLMSGEIDVEKVKVA